jgi:hypothetical protein
MPNSGAWWTTAVCLFASSLPFFGLARAADVTVRPAPVIDVLLDQGTLHGRVIDDEGRSIAGRVVVVQQGATELLRATTNESGWFVLSPIDAGQYDLIAGEIRGTYRAWHTRVAPPTAGEHALVVVARHGGRGVSQPPTGDVIILTAVGMILLVIGSAIAIDRVHRLPPTVLEDVAS